MKAIVCTKYGPPDVLELKEVEKPAPKDNEVFIKVYASTVTPIDLRFQNLAAEAADYLRDQGFTVVQFGPADRADYPRTVIVDYTDKTYALMVLTEIFNVADENIRQSPNLKSDVDIRVIIGTDFQLPEEEAQSSEFTAAEPFISYSKP